MTTACVWLHTYTHTGAVLNCDVIVNEFELKSRDYVHFLANTFRKGMNPLIPLPMSLIVLLVFFYKEEYMNVHVFAII